MALSLSSPALARGDHNTAPRVRHSGTSVGNGRLCGVTGSVTVAGVAASQAGAEAASPPPSRLQDTLSGAVARIIATPRVKSFSNGVAVTADGASLLVADGVSVGPRSIALCDVYYGSQRCVIGGPREFKEPCQVFIASDGFVFVADFRNNRVQALTPKLEFHGLVGAGKLSMPAGVCASEAIVVVSENGADRISVFSRRDGRRLRRFGSKGRGDGQLSNPYGVCFVAQQRLVAVAEYGNSRVSVFGVDGSFVRHVGVGVLKRPQGVAASAANELVVADWGCVRLFRESGALLRTLDERGAFSGIAIVGGAVYAQDQGERCVVFR